MKSIRKSRSTNIPSVILFREDIESIVSLLKKVSGNVVISDRDFEYETIEKLIEKVGPSPAALTISCRDPYVSLKFDRREFITASWLYAEAYHDEAEPTFLRLREILKGKQHWANYVIRFDVAFGLFIALMGFSSIIIPILAQWIPNAGIRVAVFLVIIAYIIIAFLLRVGALYSISLMKRHEKQTFLKQNFSAIILIAIGAIIAEVVRWLAELLTK